MTTPNAENQQVDTQTPIGAIDETPIDPVDIDLGEEDGVPAAEPAGEPVAAAEPAAAEPEPKPKIPRKDASIPKLRQRAQAAEAARQESESNAERLKRENEELRTQMAQADRAALTHYKSNVEKEVDIAKRDLTEAISAGDPEKQAQAQSQLAEASAKKVHLDQWEAANPPKQEPKPATAAAPKAPDRQPAPQALDPETEAFVASNSWFQQDHDDFDEDMTQFAVAHARVLETRLIRQGKQADIGGKAYFDQILAATQDEFPDRFEAEPAPVTPPARGLPAMTRGNGTVVPAARTPPGAPTNPNRVTLSADERRIAHQMADHGATLNADGSRMSHAQAEKAYAIQKVKQQRSA